MIARALHGLLGMIGHVVVAVVAVAVAGSDMGYIVVDLGEDCNRMELGMALQCPLPACHLAFPS